MKSLYVVDSPLVKEAVAVGRKHHRRFRPLAYAGELDEPLYHNEWWFIPIAEDKSLVPAPAMKGVELLKAQGIQVVDLIVAHESPKLLPPPHGFSAADKRKAKWERRKEQMQTAGEVASFVARSLVRAIATVALLLGWFIASVVMLDPALIVVLEDGTWLEVATWYD